MNMVEIKVAAMRKRNGSFWSKVDHGQPLDCWIWRGGYNGPMPVFRGKSAARFAYEYMYGFLDKSKRIKQKCKDNRCMNPDHMR